MKGVGVAVAVGIEVGIGVEVGIRVEVGVVVELGVRGINRGRSWSSNSSSRNTGSR